jgi:protocatechuate 3,4-dioxygenase beta subunit
MTTSPLPLDAPDHDDDHVDGGISHDLPRLLSRRRALGGVLGTAGLTLLAACASDGTTPSTSATTTAPVQQGGPGGAPPGGTGGGSSVTVADGEIPEETAGPFPGDGSNGANVLTEAGVVRSDIRSSIGGATGVAGGIPLTIRLRLVNLDGTTSTPFAGGAVYLWHADREGRYSLYSEGVTEENYLRGVQAADADGVLTFTSIFPACYDGRWPHIHFEVYESVAKATSSANKMRTSQLALPRDVCEQVYATTGYEQSVSNLARVSLDSDGVFGDGYSLQLAKMSGSNGAGWTAELTVPV